MDLEDPMEDDSQRTMIPYQHIVNDSEEDDAAAVPTQQVVLVEDSDSDW